MRYIYSNCIYTRLAIEYLCKDLDLFHSEPFLVIDTRKISSLEDLNKICVFAKHNLSVKKAVVLSNDRRDAYDFKYGIHMDAPVSDWRLILTRAIISKNSIDKIIKRIDDIKNKSILSERQNKIMKLLVNGFTPKQVSYILNIHFKTVYGHIAQIKSKLNATRLVDLYTHPYRENSK